jgi:hypothetical protein
MLVKDPTSRCSGPLTAAAEFNVRLRSVRFSNLRDAYGRHREYAQLLAVRYTDCTKSDCFEMAVASTSAGSVGFQLASVKQTSEVWDCVETTVEVGTDAGCLDATGVTSRKNPSREVTGFELSNSLP